jgi:hypothetical protein
MNKSQLFNVFWRRANLQTTLRFVRPVVMWRRRSYGWWGVEKTNTQVNCWASCFVDYL